MNYSNPFTCKMFMNPSSVPELFFFIFSEIPRFLNFLLRVGKGCRVPGMEWSLLDSGSHLLINNIWGPCWAHCWPNHPIGFTLILQLMKMLGNILTYAAVAWPLTLLEPCGFWPQYRKMHLSLLNVISKTQPTVSACQDAFECWFCHPVGEISPWSHCRPEIW